MLLVFVIFIHWIVICLVDSTIQLLNNPDLLWKKLLFYQLQYKSYGILLCLGSIVPSSLSLFFVFQEFYKHIYTQKELNLLQRCLFTIKMYTEN